MDLSPKTMQVLKLQKTLDLEIINGALIDKLGKENTEISLWIDNNDTLQVIYLYL